MSIFGNGFFSSKNVVIVNGKRINGNARNEKMEHKKIDERKFEESNNVDRIEIASTVVDINISSSKSDKIEAQFYGEADVSGKVEFDFKNTNRKLYISVEIEGSIEGNLKLDIKVPIILFKSITAESMSADITINEGIKVNCIKMESKSGDLIINTTTNEAKLSTMSGDVKFTLNAIQNVKIDASSMSGDIKLDLNDVGKVILSAHTMSGRVKNRHEGKGRFTANVNASSMSGDIIVN